MVRSLFRLSLAIAVLALVDWPAYAQVGARSSISGVVVDSGGGVIPGATVTVKNAGTGEQQVVISNAQGVFAVPALDVGTYTVTVTLQGFKNFVVSGIQLTSGAQHNVKAVLEVGALTETVEVKGGGELVNTQSPTISATLSVDQMNKLPLPTRNALNFVTFLPGVETTGQNRDSTVNGLPQGTIVITLDGVNIQDNHLKTTDGFFARVYPRQDAVEEVTVTAATPGAANAGQGAVQIGFVTRSGTNRYDTSLYEYFRHPSMNTNYFFNKTVGLPKDRVILHQYGGRVGGPVVIPKVYDGRGKAFFFFNHEEFWNPSTDTRTRTIMKELTRNGLFQYTSGGVTQQIDIFQAARDFNAATGNGVTTTQDPTVAALLAEIRTAVGTSGVVTPRSENTEAYRYQAEGAQHDQQPTVKLDYNLTNKHRLSGSYTWLHVLRDPDFLNNQSPAFPKFPNYSIQDSYRISGSSWLRSTLSSNLVNEVRFGGSWGPTWFGQNVTIDTFDNQGGYSLGLTGAGISNATIENSPSARSAYNYEFADNLNWQKGKHSFSFGTSFTQIRLWTHNWQAVPSISFGVNDADPASGIFSTGRFPGVSQGQLDEAEAIYALLTGSVTTVGGTGQLDEATGLYAYNGNLVRRARMDEWGFFAQDSYRFRPNITFNVGVRYELQMPFQPLNGVMTTATLADACGVSGFNTAGDNCRFFEPGASGGKRPEFIQYTSGTKGYNTDWNNFAPNVGVAWRPNVQDGFMRAFLGDPDQATIRAGYSVAYSRNGTSDFTGVYGSNPGDSTGANRNNNNGNILRPGESWPVLYRQKDRLGPPPVCPEGVVSAGCMQASPILPIASTSASEINIFHPDIEVSSSRSYTVGLQRALTRDMAVEVRYVGTRNVNGWTSEDYNEFNLIENGFFDEFKLAMGNLQSHLAAGCTGSGANACSYAYRGPGTGTNPLPNMLAWLVPAGQGTANRAGDSSAYTGTLWTNATLVGRLAVNSPNPASMATDIWNSAARRSASIANGLANNYFQLNPEADEVNVTKSESFSKYHSLQAEVRRRTSRGLYFNVAYTWSRRWGSAFLGQHYGRILDRTAGNPHAFRFLWTYEIPVGRGKRYGTDMNPWLDAVVGGWSFDGTGRVQTRVLNLGSVRLIGMTIDELNKEYYVRYNPETKIVSYLPQDIIDNTRRAFSVSATTANGYSTTLGAPEGRYIAPAEYPGCIDLVTGDCSPRQTFINAPLFSRFDFSLKKRFRLGGRKSAEVNFDVLNVFDNINFTPVANPGTGATIFTTNSAYQDSSNTFDPGGRLGQVVVRFNF